MAVIDPEGMFGGDRMASLTDQGRLHWPWLYTASNGMGRLELNYRKIIARVYATFRVPPTEEEFFNLIREYHECWLMFVYLSGGQAWGQWETSEKYLPRHKTTKDLQSPEPPAEELLKWREEYSRSKNSVSLCPPVFSEIFRKSLESFRENVRGVGEGVGVGVGKNHCASGDALVLVPEPRFELSSAKDPGKRERERWFDEQFWPIVWAKIGRGAARKAWVSKITTPELRDVAIKAALAQRNSILERAARTSASVLHPATWINGQRWEDEEPELPTVQRNVNGNGRLEAARKTLAEVDLSDVETAY